MVARPGKGWSVLFRLYGPLEPWFDKTWRTRRIRAGEVIDSTGRALPPLSAAVAGSQAAFPTNRSSTNNIHFGAIMKLTTKKLPESLV